MIVRTVNTYSLRLRKNDILEFLTAFFLILTFVIKAFIDGPYMRGEVGKVIAYSKYFTALFSCFFAVLSSVGKPKRVFLRGFLNMMAIMVAFILISMVMGALRGKFSLFVVLEIARPLIYLLLAFCVLNALDRDTVHRCLVIILYVCLAGYAVELLNARVSLTSILVYSFLKGDSPTESNSFSEIALSMTFYFAYRKNSKINLLVSALFTLFSFKRLAILFAAATLVIAFFFPKITRANISRWLIVVLKVLTIIVTLLWIWLLLPEQETLFLQLFGMTPYNFTSGRSDNLRLLLSSGFQSYGYGSANEYIRSLYGVPFEMDLARIAIELTPITTILVIWLFWNLAGSKMWSTFIVGFCILSMILSDLLSFNFVITVTFMVIGMVDYPEDQEDGIISIPIAGKRISFEV